jgi:hypothetical protein
VKQIAAILFLSVLLFNLCGYQLVFDYLQQQHEAKLTTRLDQADYADEDLISIKTALSMPYYTATMDFERVDGAIRIDGVEYRYVKRRIINDSLELLCLPNTTRQELQAAKTNFFKTANDLQQPEGNKKSNTSIKSVLPEYCNTVTAYTLPLPPGAKQKHRLFGTHLFSSLFDLKDAQPPEAMLYFPA